MKNKMMNLKLATVARYRDKYFFTILNINALFVFEETSGNIFYLDSFKMEREVYCMYIRSFIYKEEIWFLPAEADEIAILDIVNMQIDYIPINFQDGYCVSEFKYNNFIRFYNHYVCFIPRGVNEAVIINMETKKIENYYKLANGREQFQNAILINNILYFYPWKGKKRISLNLLSGNLKCEKWENDEKFGDSVYDKESEKIFHAPARGKHILINNIQRKTFEKKLSKCPSDNAGYHTFYSSIDNKEILFWGAKGVVSINSKESDIQYTAIREEASEGILIPIDFSPKEAFVFGGNQLFRYDHNLKKYISIEIAITFGQLINQLKKKKKSFLDLYKYLEHDYELENNLLTLKEFICLLGSSLQTNCIENVINRNQELTSSKIFSTLFYL